MNDTFEPRVSGLNGVGLEVPDVEVAQQFYTTFGLESRVYNDALLLRCQGRANDEVAVVEGDQKRIHHVSFHVQPGSLGAFADKLREWDLEPTETPPPGQEREGLWFRDPWGTWINLEPRQIQPEPVVELPDYNMGGHVNRVDVNLWQRLEEHRDPTPLRLGHVLIFTPQLERAEEFFTRALGLRASDRAVGKGVFMRAGQGTVDHHCFGLIQSSHPGLQHASFYVSSFDDIGYGAWHMRKAGYEGLFGPGRHAIASNLFQYIRDPWGSWIEYYSDMDKITDNWVCRDWESLPYTWGPRWSPEFWSEDMNGNFEPKP